MRDDRHTRAGTFQERCLARRDLAAAHNQDRSVLQNQENRKMPHPLRLQNHTDRSYTPFVRAALAANIRRGLHAMRAMRSVP